MTGAAAMGRAGGRPAAPVRAARSAAVAAPTEPVLPASAHADESLGLLMKRTVVLLAAESDRRLADHGLTSAQCGLLMKLAGSGRATVCELARSLEVDSGSTTRLLDRLERKRLVARRRSGDDRRVVWIELTEEGGALAARVAAIPADVLNAHLAGFSISEFRALKTYLVRMLDNGDAGSAWRTVQPAET